MLFRSQINEDNVFEKLYKVAKQAEKNYLFAEQIRLIFENDVGEYAIGNFIELRSDSEEGDSIGDIHGVFQTIYENSIETELYDDTIETFAHLSAYIEKVVGDFSLCSLDEINELREEIEFLSK